MLMFRAGDAWCGCPSASSTATPSVPTNYLLWLELTPAVPSVFEPNAWAPPRLLPNELYAGGLQELSEFSTRSLRRFAATTGVPLATLISKE